MMAPLNNFSGWFRRYLALVVSIFCVATVGARAGWIEDREDGSTVIHLKLWSVPDPSNPDTANMANVAVVKRFKQRFSELFSERWRAEYEANPDLYGDHNWDRVSIELHRATGIQVQGVETDLLQIAGDLAPDVMYINFRKSDTYVRNRFLYPLDEYIGRLSREEYDARVHPKIDPVIHRRGPDGDKHYWAMPFGGMLGRVLLYRKDLFDAHHIAYPDVNWRWEDFYDAARKITDPERGIVGCRLGRGGWYWLTWLWSAGGDVMTYNEATDEWRCVFGSRAAARALDFNVRLGVEKWIDADGNIQRGYSNIEVSEDVRRKWDRGEVGMMLEYISEDVFATIDPEVTGMAPVPLGPPDPATGKRARGGELNSQMMGMFSGIKEKAIRDAAWEYMQFYDSDEAMAIRTRIMVEGGLGRFLNPAQLRKFGYDDVVRLAPKGWEDIFRIAIETGKPEPYGKNSNLAYMMMGPPVDRAMELGARDALPEDSEERLDVLEALLKEAEDRANEAMIGLVPRRELVLRRIASSLLLIGIVVAYTFVFRRIFKAFTPPEAAQSGNTGWQFRRYKWAYLILVPAVLTILTWRYIPLMRGSYMAFFDYRLIGKSSFVGLDNFGELLFDSLWWRSIWNALRYSFLVIGLTFLPPIVLAIALQEVPRGKLVYRLIFYLPAVITGLVTVLLWKQFYQPNERGALNALVMSIPAWGFVAIGLLLLGICLAFARRLSIHRMWMPVSLFVLAGVCMFAAASALSLPILFLPGESFAGALAAIPGRLLQTLPEPYRWLTDSRTAMLSCVIPMVWAGMGPGCLIYLAALKGIPDDYYEAADIDGASFLDKILFIVFPTLKALIIINFVGVFISSWYGATGNILVMTGGQANTETVGLHIWYKAFTFLKFGPATAGAWMLAFMLIGFTVNQLRILSRVEFKAAGGGDK
jgi:ABC-type sugar transport system permease subunit